VEPEKYVDAFARAGAANITVHVEASPRAMTRPAGKKTKASARN
jgi:pentose-5-phosphate-3-epimerase